jgi:hypothetical protein
MRSLCYVSVNLPPSECLNQSLRNLVCNHGTSANLNGIIHKFLPSVCVSLLLLIGKDLVNTFPRQQIHATPKNCWANMFVGKSVYLPSLLNNNSAKTNRSRGNEEMLKASLSMRSVSYERETGD